MIIFVVLAALAQADGGSTTPSWDYLLNFGVLGFVAVAFLIGWIWPRPSVDRLQAELVEAKAQRDALLTVYEEKVIPVIADLNATIVPAMANHTRRVEENSTKLEAVERELRVLSSKIREG